MELWYFRHYGQIGKINQASIRHIVLTNGETPHIIINRDFVKSLESRNNSLNASIVIKQLNHEQWSLSLKFVDWNHRMECDILLFSLVLMIQACLIRGGDKVFVDRDTHTYMINHVHAYMSTQTSLIRSQRECIENCLKSYPEVFEKLEHQRVAENDYLPAYYHDLRMLVHHHHMLDRFELVHTLKWLEAYLGKMELNSYSLFSKDKRISVLDVNIHCTDVYSVYISEVSVIDCSKRRGKAMYMTTKEHNHYSNHVSPGERMVLMSIKLFLNLIVHMSEPESEDSPVIINSTIQAIIDTIAEHSDFGGGVDPKSLDFAYQRMVSKESGFSPALTMIITLENMKAFCNSFTHFILGTPPPRQQEQ